MENLTVHVQGQAVQEETLDRLTPWRWTDFCPETSVNNYQSALSNIPEKKKISGRLKSESHPIIALDWKTFFYNCCSLEPGIAVIRFKINLTLAATLYGFHHYIATWRLTLMHQYMIYRPTGTLACDEGSCFWLMDLVASMSVMGMEYAPNSSWFDLAWLDLIPTLFKLFKADKVIWDILHKVCQNLGHFTCNYDLKNAVSTCPIVQRYTL